MDAIPKVARRLAWLLVVPFLSDHNIIDVYLRSAAYPCVLPLGRDVKEPTTGTFLLDDRSYGYEKAKGKHIRGLIQDEYVEGDHKHPGGRWPHGILEVGVLLLSLVAGLLMSRDLQKSQL